MTPPDYPARAERYAREAVLEGRPVVAASAVAALLDQLDEARTAVTRAAAARVAARHNFVAGTPLTDRQLEILAVAANSATVAEAANRLSLSFHTVSGQLDVCRRKLGVSSTVAAAQRARALGLLAGTGRSGSSCPNGRCRHPRWLHDVVEQPGPRIEFCTVDDCRCRTPEGRVVNFELLADRGAALTIACDAPSPRPPRKDTPTMTDQAPVERLIIDTFPPEPVQVAMIDWFAQHGIDGNHVPIPGWVERRPASNAVAVELYHLGEHGRPHLDASGDEAVRFVHVQQLDHPPEPFPAAVHEWLAEGRRARQKMADYVAANQRTAGTER